MENENQTDIQVEGKEDNNIATATDENISQEIQNQPPTLPEITPQLIHEDVKKLVEQHAIKLGLNEVTIDVAPGTKLGDNFLGFIGKLTIKGKLKTGEEKTFNWIIKTAPTNELYRTILNVSFLYERETFVYEEIFPTYKQFQMEKRILKPFNEHAELIFTTMEPMKESIVMKDMKHIGYVMRPRQEPLSLNHVRLVMKAYAKLHAMSYALKDQKPDVFNKLAGNVDDIFIRTVRDEDAYKNQQPMLLTALESLDPIQNAKAIEKFKKFSEKFIEIVKDRVGKTNEYSVIGHGDSWGNNILWKYEDINNPTIPTKVCLLDWQICRYGSPALDLSYFLFACTNKEFRDKYYDDMIRLYYYTLSEHINDLGSVPEKLLPFEALLKELKDSSIAGIYMSIFALYIITRESSEMAEWSAEDLDVDELTKQWKVRSVNADKYEERVRGIILNSFEKGYLDFII